MLYYYILTKENKLMMYWIIFKMALFALCAIITLPLMILLTYLGVEGLGNRIMGAMEVFVDELEETGSFSVEQMKELRELLNTH